jgi:MoxR-like ATPase
MNLNQKIAHYLYQEKTRGNRFIISPEAAKLHADFLKYLKEKKAFLKYEKSVSALADSPNEQFELIQQWVSAFQANGQVADNEVVMEVAVLLLTENFDPKHVVHTETRKEIAGMHGEHGVLKSGKYELDYNRFIAKLTEFQQTEVPKYEQFTALKKSLAEQRKKALRLEEFKPRVLSSFVRNKLIDKVYLPIFGDNLAKQIGTAGEETRTDRMGLLLLISPPGYGKTTLMEYIASRLGLIFMKINGPALGHHITSLDPADAPNRAAAQELEKLNLALEMGDNTMLYLDDIQHCNPEFLQKFISLCDAQRKIEGIWKGETKTYDFRGKRVAVVMAGNPYTESGDKFQIPDMLANRADIYNLGDIIGDDAAVFKMSYLENSLTSNSTLAQLANKSMKDVYTLISMAETGQKDGLNFEANHSPAELNEYTSVLKKMLRIRDVILKVNQEYIRSAAISEDYREEPAFKLQGSYRNMNKLAEKVVPIMNDKELETLIVAHYEGEVQTLTSDAEANFLKLKELMNNQTAEEVARWADIKQTFSKNNAMRGVGADNPMGQVVAQMRGIREALEKE